MEVHRGECIYLFWKVHWGCEVDRSPAAAVHIHGPDVVKVRDKPHSVAKMRQSGSRYRN
jgi:hypothetical protein